MATLACTPGTPARGFARLAAIAALALTGPLLAQQPVAGKPSIVEPYARATPPGARTAGVYLTIRNRGGAADTLTGARTAAAADVEIHTTSTAGGVMRMRAVEQLPVPPGQDVRLAPGGVHLMLIDPRQPLREGDRFTLTLLFARAGAIDAEVKVQPMSAGAPVRHAH